MAKNSKIAWTNDTLNAVIGCTKQSEGCRNCYAILDAARMSGNPRFSEEERNLYGSAVTKDETGAWRWTGKVSFYRERLQKFGRSRKPLLVFVDSLSDLFHSDVPDEVIFEHYELFAQYPQHQFQVLTKRSERLAELSPKLTWSQNVWQGVTVEGPEQAERITHLAATDAVIKWVSIEPLLSREEPLAARWPNLRKLVQNSGIAWVVVGGESSRSKDVARLMTLDDAHYVLTECAAGGARVFLKQLGTRWAIISGTYGNKVDRRQSEVRKGGFRELWPKKLQTDKFLQYPRSSFSGSKS